MRTHAMTFAKDPATATPAASSAPAVLTVDGRDYTQAELETKIRSQDSFIDTLQGENATNLNNSDDLLKKITALEARLNASNKAAELLTETQQTAPATTPAAAPTETATLPSTEDLTASVKEALRQEEVIAKQKVNMEKAMQGATEAYGAESASAKVLEIGTSLGYDAAGVDALAKDNPTVFAKLFLPESKAVTPPVGSTVQGAGNPATAPAVNSGKSWMDMTQKERTANINARMAAIEGQN